MTILVEDGRGEIEIDPTFEPKPGEPFACRVKGTDGEWYDHVREDESGRWVFRHTNAT